MMLAFQLLMCVAFVELFILFRIGKNASDLVDLSRRSVEILRSSEIDDDQKEAFARRTSLLALKTTGSIVLKFALVVLALYVISVIATAVLSVSMDSFIEVMLSARVLITMTIVSVAYVWIRHGVRRRL